MGDTILFRFPLEKCEQKCDLKEIIFEIVANSLEN